MGRGNEDDKAPAGRPVTAEILSFPFCQPPHFRELKLRFTRGLKATNQAAR